MEQFNFSFGRYRVMIQKITEKKNEQINRVLLGVVNSAIDNHAGAFVDVEWEFVLKVSKKTMEFLSLKGNMQREDTNAMFDIIHKVKNMYLSRLEGESLNNFIGICDR
jgi:hypothetical protein